MLRSILLSILTLMLGLPAFAATTVTLNGKTVTVPAIESKGKAYVDVVTLMRLLGGSATYNASTHKVAISTGKPAAGSSASGKSAGTVQLAGDNGEIGKVYSLGKRNPLYFSLKSAEFTVGQMIVKENLYSPKENEKLLVVHFTVQNPQKSDRYIRWDALKMMAVDAMNVNHECCSDWGDEISKQSVGISLKPAQSIACYAAFRVPAKGPIPKLMVQSNDADAPVLRYDLRDKIKPLAAPFADPSDPSGVTALETVPAELNVAYPYDRFDITVEKFDYADKLGDKKTPNGERYLMATVKLKNIHPRELYARWDAVQPLLTSEDGEELRYKDMLLANTDRTFAQSIKGNSEIRVRLAFTVPKDATPKTLAIKERESRSYEYEVK